VKAGEAYSGKLLRSGTPLLIQEGWTRHQERCREATFDGADGVVRYDETLRPADHPVCGAKVGFASVFSMPQPPLYQEGSCQRPTLLGNRPFSPSVPRLLTRAEARDYITHNAMNILCFDISSGGISAAIVDSDLQPARFVETPWVLEADEFGAAVLSVTKIAEQFKSAILQLKLTAADRIDAICIDTFMHNCALLDAADRPLTPVFTWLDHRGADGIELLRSRMGDRFHQRTGCRFHPMFPVFKLASMRLDDNPAISAAKRIVSIKSILLHKLTGVWMEDYGIASSSGLFNERQRVWDTEILSLLDVSPACFPQVASRENIVGRLSNQAAAEFALPEGIAVVNGTGDGFAAHLGSGCEMADRISVTLGTSAVVRQALPRPVLAPTAGTFCYVADENVYLLGCAGSNGGNVLDWGRAVLRESRHAQAGPDVPIFIPLLHGERSPEWDPGLTGSWYGLTARHTAADLSRSILEGVIFNFGYFLDIVQQASGVRATSLVLSGNGFLDPIAAPILAAITGAFVGTPERPGLMTLRGTAICGLRALGAAIPPLMTRIIEPSDDAKMLRRYTEYRRFRGTLARV
jgi:gluconokinase